MGEPTFGANTKTRTKILLAVLLDLAKGVVSANGADLNIEVSTDGSRVEVKPWASVGKKDQTVSLRSDQKRLIVSHVTVKFLAAQMQAVVERDSIWDQNVLQQKGRKEWLSTKVDLVREVLTDYLQADFMGILQDYRKSKRSGNWQFTLELWHPLDEANAKEKNLKAFEQEWKQLAALKNAGDAVQRPVAVPPNNIDSRRDVKKAEEFVGRERVLVQLHAQLQQADRVAISAVVGMGGIGKTELALQYAFQHLELRTYPGGICWLNARGDLGTQIVSFARAELGLLPPEKADLMNQVKHCWKNWTPGTVLLVLDDVQSLDDLRDVQGCDPNSSWLPPPDSRFRVLLTTRLQLALQEQNPRAHLRFEMLELKVLTEAASLCLLRVLIADGKRDETIGAANPAGRIDAEIDTAKEICEWLGYLPLGLELVGRYLARKPELSLADLRQQLLDKKLEAKALNNKAWGVAAAFELSWEMLDESAQQLAAFLSLFALAEIPWFLVEACEIATRDADAEALEALADLRDEKLLGLHLLQRVEEGLYQLHQLLHEFFADKRAQIPVVKARESGFLAVMGNAAQISGTRPAKSLIQETEWVRPHLQIAINRAERAGNDDDVAFGLAQMAILYISQGYYAEAEPLAQRSLEILEQQLGTDHPHVAATLNNLAYLYRLQGRYSEAEPLYRRALEIRERQGADHPDVAATLNNLANLYRHQGHYSKAESLLLRAVEIGERQRGADHLQGVDSLSNLAILYWSQGRYSEAEPLYRRALEIREQQLGTDHPHVATSLNNLANLYYSQGRYSEVEPLHLRALEIRERQLGADHSDVAVTLSNLASLYHLQDRYSEAEALFLRALEIYKQQLGADHPKVANCLSNLAHLYQSQGRYSEVEPLHRRALEICERQLGADHPDVAVTLSNLASLYHSQGRYSEAEPLYRRAMEIRIAKLGVNHPKTENVRNGLFLTSLYLAVFSRL